MLIWQGSLQTKAVCGVLLSLVGNAGTLITYTIGIFVNWRQLAFILVLLAFPYVVGLIIFLPNDFPALRKRKLERKRQAPAEKNITSSTEKFFQQQHPEITTNKVNFTKTIKKTCRFRNQSPYPTKNLSTSNFLKTSFFPSTFFNVLHYKIQCYYTIVTLCLIWCVFSTNRKRVLWKT